MEKTWKPTVAGILAIIAGVPNLIGVLGMIVAIVVTTSATLKIPGLFIPGTETIPGFVPVILAIIATAIAFVGILAIVGGVFALQRKNWGLALAGAIAAFLPWSLLGIAAIVLIALSKNEFE